MSWDREDGLSRPGPVASEAAGVSTLSMLRVGDNGLAEEDSSRPRRPVIPLQISFDVLRARAASGVFSESGKIWNHLDEEAIPADTAVILQRNGLRVARGKEDSWPPIKALLEDEEHVETSTNHVAVNNGLPLMVELDRWPRDQVLFLFRPDGSLGGASFPESTNLLRIEYDISLDRRPGALEVNVMPEIRLPPTPPRFRFGESGFVQGRRQQPTRVLRELAFAMEVGPDEFFVVGPGPRMERGHLAGSLLLCEEIEGRRFESIYFITPRVTGTGRSAGP